MGAAGTGLAFTPFVPFGNFMPNPRTASVERTPVEYSYDLAKKSETTGEIVYLDWKAVLRDDDLDPSADYVVSVEHDKVTVHASLDFPMNSEKTTTYPKTGDPILDGEPFRKWKLIRLPKELGGDAKDASAFRVYSAICIHLWCIWEYKPDDDKRFGACPCHGSLYNASTGKAFKGPAAVQGAPSNVLPKLDLEVDERGRLWFKQPNMNVYENGVVGYGRYL